MAKGAARARHRRARPPARASWWRVWLAHWEADYSAMGWADWAWMVAALLLTGAIAVALLWLRWLDGTNQLPPF